MLFSAHDLCVLPLWICKVNCDWLVRADVTEIALSARFRWQFFSGRVKQTPRNRLCSQATSAHKFVELLSKSAQSKGNKLAPKLSNKEEEKESEEEEADKDKFDSKDFDRLFKGIKKSTVTVYSGDEDLYHDWKAQFEIFVDPRW